jgi:hypothetical protein
VTVPLWALLGFATWTVLLLLGTVGVYRWSRIHVSFEPTNTVVSVRFGFFVVQVVGFFWLIAIVVERAMHPSA